MAAQDYIISFDFAAIQRQISGLQDSYSKLNDTFKKSANESTAIISSLEDQFSKLSSVIATSFDNMQLFYASLTGNLEKTDMMYKSIFKTMKQLSKDTLKMGAAASSEKKDASKDKGEGEDSKITDRIKKVMDKLKGQAKDANTTIGKLTLAFETLKGVVDKEFKNAGKAVASSANNLLGGALPDMGGSLFGGLLGIIVGGIQWRQRQGAERGEMFNVVEASGEVFSKYGGAIVDKFAAFGEKAQFQYNVSRQEVQKAVGIAVNAGLKSKELIKDLSKDIGKVGENTTITSVALDKHFGMAGGTSMQKSVEIMEKYGGSLDQAYKKYEDLMFMAQRSGMSMEKYVDAVMSGSSAMVQYGIDMKDTVHVMEQMRKHYEAMGMDKKQAGAWAADTTKGIMQGVAGMNEQFKLLVAQKMFNTSDVFKASRLINEGVQRYASGENKDFQIQYFNTIKNTLQEMFGSKEDVKLMALQDGTIASMKTADAMAFLASTFKEGQELEGKSKAQADAFMKAFETEGKTLTDLQKVQKDLIEGMAKIGEGLLQILTGLVGVFIVGFKSLIAGSGALVKAFFGTPDEKADAQKTFDYISENMGIQTAAIGTGVTRLAQGLGETGKALAGAMDVVMGQTVDALKKAIDMRVGYGPEGITETVAEVIADVASVKQGLYLLGHEVNAQLEGIFQAVLSGVGAEDLAKSWRASTQERMSRVGDFYDAGRLEEQRKLRYGDKLPPSQRAKKGSGNTKVTASGKDINTANYITESGMVK